MKKTHVNSNVDLNTLAGGAFAEKVNEALVQVGENIQNQNTEATKTGKNTPENWLDYTRSTSARVLPEKEQTPQATPGLSGNQGATRTQ